MKTMNKIFIAIVALALVLVVSCTKDQTTDLSQEQNLERSIDDVDAKAKLMDETINHQQRVVAISYIGSLCDVVTGTHASERSYTNSDLFDYYYFDGTAGDVVDITVLRTTPGLDTGMTLYFGTTGDSSGVTYNSGGPNMTFLRFTDDSVFNPSCFGDPSLIGFVLPSTGTYTLAVFDVQGCGFPKDYEIITSGISCDSDGDGCADVNDEIINSNMEATVTIDGCDSGVPNEVTLDSCGITMSDLMDALELGDYRNHGQFVRAVAHVVNGWYDSELITLEEKDAIMTCAGQANIPS